MVAALALGILVFALAPTSAASEAIAELAFLDELPASGAAGEGQIAIDLAPRGRRPFPLLLDTGASQTRLSAPYASRLRVPDRGPEAATYSVETALDRELEFVVDSAPGRDVGVLGGDFLADAILDIDYAQRLVRFLTPYGARMWERDAGPAGIRAPLGLVEGRPIVRIEVGSGSAWFVVDTGSDHDLLASAQTARALGFAALPDAVVALSTVRVAGHAVSGAQLRISGGSGEARVGNAFLRRFRVLIDYPDRELQLVPRRVGAEQTREVAHRERRPARAAAVPDPAGRVRAPSTGPAPVWLEVEMPEMSGVHAGPVGLLEVAGWAGEGPQGEHDLAVVVDVSGSTAFASGVDVDGDGKLGRARRRESWRNFNPRWLSSDADDTILAAELVATNRLVEVLDPERTRIGIVSFHGAARLHAPVGSAPDLIAEALAELDGSFGSGMTNLAEATSTAARELLSERADAPSEPRGELSILILSDGYPTSPGSEAHAAAAAIEAAREAALAGIRIYTFALGIEELQGNGDRDVFAEMARLSGGAHVRLENPGDVVHELPRIDLARIASVDLRNATTGEPGRAVRVFPDGSFDGYVPLATGENTIEIVARGDGGGERRVERRVRFEKRAPRDALEAEEFDAMLRRLRDSLQARTAETELALRAQGRREAGELLRDLRIGIEEGD